MMVISNGERKGSWHVGETMRIPEGYVITFQADGHELTALLEAIQAAGIEVAWGAKQLTPIL